MIYSLTLPGIPRTKKTSNRIVRPRGRKYPRILPSKAHQAWFVGALWYLRQHWKEPTIANQVHISAVFYRDANRGDLVGYLQALGDLLQAAKVITNDVQIASWDGSRLAKDKSNPRIELTIVAV